VSVTPIRLFGDPVLRTRATEVTTFDAELRKLVADLADTMHDEGGAGLAAPQIGVSERVVIFGVAANPRYPDAEAVPFTVLVNPKLVMLTREVEEDWEGCLSVPGLRGIVPRYTKLRYAGFDAEGNPIERVAEGFHARVVQHECDHLDGILYPQRMTDLGKLGFIEELFPGEDIHDD
jgi:peptide deformylase